MYFCYVIVITIYCQSLLPPFTNWWNPISPLVTPHLHCRTTFHILSACRGQGTLRTHPHTVRMSSAFARACVCFVYSFYAVSFPASKRTAAHRTKNPLKAPRTERCSGGRRGGFCRPLMGSRCGTTRVRFGERRRERATQHFRSQHPKPYAKAASHTWMESGWKVGGKWVVDVCVCQ